jgi:hypothetical protein
VQKVQMHQQMLQQIKKVLKKNKIYMYMNELDSQSQSLENIENLESLENLDEIIIKLNDQIGIMGNNLIEKQIELDYLKEVNEQLKRTGKLDSIHMMI